MCWHHDDRRRWMVLPPLTGTQVMGQGACLVHSRYADWWGSWVWWGSGGKSCGQKWEDLWTRWEWSWPHQG